MSGEPRDPEQESHPAEPTGEESVATLVRPPGEERTQELARSTPDSSGDLDLELPRLQPDELLAGRFSIVRFIARGGMGAVYEAEDMSLRTRVALKIIRRALLADASALERFRREVL